MQDEENQTHKKDSHTVKKFITITHYNRFTQKIAKSFKKREYNIAYTTKNSLKRHLKNKNTKHKKHTSTGVNKLKCNDCAK